MTGIRLLLLAPAYALVNYRLQAQSLKAESPRLIAVYQPGDKYQAHLPLVVV